MRASQLQRCNGSGGRPNVDVGASPWKTLPRVGADGLRHGPWTMYSGAIGRTLLASLGRCGWRAGRPTRGVGRVSAEPLAAWAARVDSFESGVLARKPPARVASSARGIVGVENKVGDKAEDKARTMRKGKVERPGGGAGMGPRGGRLGRLNDGYSRQEGFTFTFFGGLAVVRVLVLVASISTGRPLPPFAPLLLLPGSSECDGKLLTMPRRPVG